MTNQKESKLTQTIKKEIIKIVVERIREAHETRENFSEPKGLVKEVAEAGRHDEQRSIRLEVIVGKLAEAQNYLRLSSFHYVSSNHRPN